jgi:hypothetical protein
VVFRLLSAQQPLTGPKGAQSLPAYSASSVTTQASVVGVEHSDWGTGVVKRHLSGDSMIRRESR